MNCPPLDPCLCDLNLTSIEPVIDNGDTQIEFRPDCRGSKVLINTCCAGQDCGLKYRLTVRTSIASNELVEAAFEAYQASKCLDGCVSIADDHYWFVSNPSLQNKLQGRSWTFSSPPKITSITNSPEFESNIYELEMTLESI